MPYDFTPLAVPYVVSLVVTTLLLGVLWQHRDRRAAKGFLLDVAGTILLSAVMVLKLSATDLTTKVFWWNWRFLAVSCMSIGYMLMAVEYTDNDSLLDRRVGIGLGTAVVLTQVAVVTNGRDGLLYTTTASDLQNGLLVPSFGPLYWVYATIMVGCIAVAVTLLLTLFRSRPGFRTQATVLVATITLVMSGVVLWWARVLPVDVLALTSAVKVIGFYVAVERLQLLETLPVARATVFRNMEDAVFVLNERGQVVDVNPTAKSLVGERGVTGESIDDVVDVDVAADVRAASAASGDAADLENREVTLSRGGETRYYDLELSRFPDGTGAVAVFRDITERRNREQEIKILNRIVRHDIRNEMNVLSGRAQLLEPHLDAAAADDYQLVLESAQHVTEITETVRELMETITRGGSIDGRPLSLSSVLAAVTTKARTNFPQASIRYESPGTDVYVAGNEMLSSVFTNLLNNAVVHNDGENPNVWVDVTVDGDVVRVTVADDGPGVPSDQRDEIFGRGEKGLASEGTGVGLYLVETLTTEFGGSVWVEDAPQGGAAFVVEFPIVDSDDGDRVAVEDAGSGATGRAGTPASDGGDDAEPSEGARTDG